jgi:hypothetical protein
VLKEKYEFDLTVAQRCAIRDACIDTKNVFFCADGMVTGIKFEDYDIEVFTFRKDGSIVKEVRDFSDGWVTSNCDINGIWRDEEGEEIE